MKRFDFRKMIRSIGEALIGEVALIIYHVIVFVALCAVAIINGNNTFPVGIVVAIVSLLISYAIGAEIHEKNPDGKLAKYFDFHSKRVTLRQYFWIAPLPIAIVLISSCMVRISPSSALASSDAGLSNPVAVIERDGTDTITVVGKGGIGFFIPGIQRVKWDFLGQSITTSPIVLRTKDGKAVQGAVTAVLRFAEDDESIIKNHQNYNSREQLRGAIEEAINGALAKTLSKQNLKTLPSQITIEDLTGSGVDFKKFSIRSVTIKLSDMHRYFEVK